MGSFTFGESSLTGNDMPSEYQIPWGDLHEVLRSWSGQGQLYEALAAVPDDQTGLRWSRRDVERRAHRVIFEELLSDIQRWPMSEVDWLDALPAQSHRARRVLTSPGAGTDWAATRALGWPPEQFVVRERSRTADQLMVRTLRWVLDSLAAVSRDAASLDPEIVRPVERQLGVALSLLQREPLVSADGMRPESADVLALKRSGRPWTAVAAVAARLRGALAGDLLETARRHIAPIEQLRWRLFHLAVFGGVLRTLRSGDASLVNLRPLSGSGTKGPNYRVTTNAGKTWDLWFEAAGMWSYYGWSSPYRMLTEGAFGAGSSPLGADIALIQPGEEAVLLECKYGPQDYVSRNGYHQAVTYAEEASQNLRGPVLSVVVGPELVVASPAQVRLGTITIAMSNPSHAAELLAFRLSES
jgi:hypothetical protein